LVRTKLAPFRDKPVWNAIASARRGGGGDVVEKKKTSFIFDIGDFKKKDPKGVGQGVGLCLAIALLGCDKEGWSA